MPHERTRRMLGVLALFGFGLAAPAGANLLVNGSFETGPVPGDAVQLDSGSTAITGWVVRPSSVDYVGTLWTAAEGFRSLALNGAAAGGIAQTFATLPGVHYSLRFYMAGDPGTLPVIKHLRASAAGQSGDFTADITGMWAWDPGWNPHNWTFLAFSTQTTLEFTSLDTGDVGPSIDSVSVTALTPVDAQAESGVCSLSPVWPNPVRDLGQVEFSVPRAGPVGVRVLDVSGREVATLARQLFSPGRHQLTWDASRGLVPAPAGVYFVELRAANTRLVQRVVLLR